MTATVRSVRVEMDLKVDRYIKSARLVGRETDRMADRIEKRFASTNKQLGDTERRLTGISRSEQAVAASTTTMNRELGNTNKVLDRNNKALDTFSGRARLALELVAGFGPALVPLGGIALAAISGVTAQLGFATAAGGSAILAFQGVGDALSAIEKARLEPTVDNLEAARDAVTRLAPEAQKLVHHLEDLRDEGRELQFAAAGGFLPGVDAALTDLEDRIPQAKRILTEISDAAGDAIADGAESLASDRWDRFFRYLETEGRPQLDGLADSVGNVAHGVAELFAATAGLQGDFTGWLRQSTEDFDTWATRLGASDEYAEFVDYVRANGPQVAETFGALANAIIQVVEAASPLGGPALEALEAVADVVSAIADSDLGTPILTGLAALSLYTRATKVLGATSASSLGQIVRGQKQVDLGYARGSAFVTTMGRDLNNVARYGTLATESSKRLGSQLGTAARAAGPIAGLAVASSGAADSIGLTNTASMALMGTLAGPWGAAVGGAIGLGMDLAGTNDTVTASLERMQSAFDGITDPRNADVLGLKSQLEQTRAEVDRFQQDMQDIDWFGKPVGPGDLLKGAKNDIEGLFGMSDNEENRAALEDLEEQYRQISAAAASLDGGQYMAAARGMAEADREQAAAAQEAVSAMRAKRQEALRGLNAELNYEQAIDDANASLRENGKTVDETTNKGRDNLRTLYALAAGWNDQSDAAKNAKGSLREARQGFIETATDMGMAEEKAKRLAARLFEIPAKRRTEILVETDLAMSRLSALKNRYDAIRDKSVTIRMNTVAGPGPARPMGVPLGGGIADGGTIRGQRQPYGDKVLAYLAPGEEVISNRRGQADRFRPLLKRINRMADGGTAGVPTYTSRRGTPMSNDMPMMLSNELGPVRSTAEAVAASLKRLEGRLDKVGRAYDREKSKLDSLTSARQSTADAVSSSLLNNPFGNGLAGFDAQLEADAGDISALGQALATLVRNGLDPKSALYQRLAAEADVNTAQQLAQLSSVDLAQRAQRFEAVASQASALGNTVAGQAFDESIRDQTGALRELREELRDLRGAIRDFKKVPHEMHDAVLTASHQGTASGAEKGTRAGQDEHRRSFAAEIRTGGGRPLVAR